MQDNPRTIDVVLDIPTHLVLTENLRLTPFVRAAIVKSLRGIASSHASKFVEDNPEFTAFRHYIVRFEVLGMNKGLRLDPTNYAPTLKPIIDGFTGRWWDDDDAGHLLETTFAYGGLWKSPPEEPIKYRRFRIRITEVNPEHYTAEPIERPYLEEIASQWELDPAYSIPKVPQDGKTDPNDGVKQYFKLITREERKKEAKKLKTAASKLLNEPEEDSEIKIEVTIPAPDATPPDPVELDW